MPKNDAVGRRGRIDPLQPPLARPFHQSDHNLALKTDGAVRSWGYNYHGELGNGTSGAGTDRSTPGSVIGLENVRSISGGAYHSLAVLESGRARAWGYNEYGQLGNGASGAAADSDVPVAVKNLTGVRNMDGGYVHTLAVAP
jgi:alpha-tubulin suppressor-like RCC1 family protein